jgi:hypothetical protein
MGRSWKALVSLRTTALLLVALSALLLINVLLPQRDSHPAAHAAALRAGPIARFTLVTLGFGQVATSPAFVVTLAALFANLAAVLMDRLGTTARRIRFASPSEAQVAALLAGGAALSLAARSPVPPQQAVDVLGRLGYRAVPIGARAVWGVKHRLALLGFPLFHASFFLMLAGAVQIYLTRDVVTVVGAEGQSLDSRRGGLVRRAPTGAAEPVQLTIERIDVRLEEGQPVDLAVTLVREGGGETAVSRVNHPARWGPLTALVERAGIAPVLWLLDGAGYTLDRVVVPTAALDGSPTRLELGGTNGVEAVVKRIPLSEAFPMRDALASTPVSLRVLHRGAEVFDGSLRPGESVAVGGGLLRLQEVRYWAGLRLVSERGGALLVAGFALAVIGIVWRMLWYRREIAVGWSGEALVIAGRCEFFPARFHDEVEAVGRLLGGDKGPVSRISA